jgi:hypothetical protein
MLPRVGNQRLQQVMMFLQLVFLAKADQPACLQCGQDCVGETAA